MLSHNFGGSSAALAVRHSNAQEFHKAFLREMLGYRDWLYPCLLPKPSGKIWKPYHQYHINHISITQMCVTSKSSKSLYAKALIIRRDICPFWVGTSAEARTFRQFGSWRDFQFLRQSAWPPGLSFSQLHNLFSCKLDSWSRVWGVWRLGFTRPGAPKEKTRCDADVMQKMNKNESSYRMSKSGLSQHPCIFCESVWHSSLWEAGGELGPSNMVLSESALDEIQCNTVNMSVKKIQRLGRNRTTADWKARLQIRMIVFSRA